MEFTNLKVLVFMFICLHGSESIRFYNIIRTAQNLNLTTLLSYIAKADLTKTLQYNGPFSMFAPSNEVFDMLPAEEKNKLNSNSTYLAEVLKNHVVAKDLPSFLIDNDDTQETLNDGYQMRFNVYNKQATYTANGAEIVKWNNVASNGIVHIINKVLLKPSSQNAFNYISTSGEVSSLLYAAIKAKIQTALSEGPITIFAPTNSAFQKLPAGDFNNLVNNETAIKDVLLNHVVEGSYYSAGLSDNQVLNTLNNNELDVTITNGDYKISGSTVTVADISVTNGVIHLVDTVILPPEYR